VAWALGLLEASYKDAAGIAAEFTPDALFVELLPRLEVMRGKAEIQKHYQQLFVRRRHQL
jgi:ketosteroid isomerase-like protein